jgi:hypothetical protein
MRQARVEHEKVMVFEVRQVSEAGRRPSRVYRKVEETASPASPSRTTNLAVTGVFLVMIVLPPMGLFFGLDRSFVLQENRPLAQRPRLTLDRGGLSGFRAKFEAYYNDQFGFRKRLIHWLALLKVKGLGITASPGVILGDNGWLYLANDFALESYRATRPYTPRQLEGYERILECRRDWLAQRGIRYLVVILPHKDTVYPEFMPKAYNKLNLRSRFDQLWDHMKTHSSVRIVDVREDMQRARTRELLYDLTDTHWNARGAYVGYVRIVEALSIWFPRMRVQPRSDFRDTATIGPGGDLALMLGLCAELPENRLGLEPLAPRRARQTNEVFPLLPGMAPSRATFATERDDAELPKAVMFRDSFASNLIPFLSEHFARAVYVWTYNFDRGVVLRERPDVVIQELVERSLQGPLPTDF